MATAAFHQLSVNEHIDARLDQLVELLYRQLPERVVGSPREPTTVGVPDWSQLDNRDSKAAQQIFVTMHSRPASQVELSTQAQPKLLCDEPDFTVVLGSAALDQIDILREVALE